MLPGDPSDPEALVCTENPLDPHSTSCPHGSQRTRSGGRCSFPVGILEAGLNSAWVKMRSNLRRDPRVIGMSRALLRDPAFIQHFVVTSRDVTVTDGDPGDVTEPCITLALARFAVVGALLDVWGMVRDSCKRDGESLDAVMTACDPGGLDEACDCPGIAAAMQSVHWVRFEARDGLPVAIFPNFLDDSSLSSESQERTKAASRASSERYRAKQKALREGSAPGSPGGEAAGPDGDVTVTSRDESRGEKRRVEKKKSERAPRAKPPKPTAEADPIPPAASRDVTGDVRDDHGDVTRDDHADHRHNHGDPGVDDLAGVPVPQPKRGGAAAGRSANELAALVVKLYPREGGHVKGAKAAADAARRISITPGHAGQDDPWAYLLERTKAFAESPAATPPPAGKKDWRKGSASWFGDGHYDDPRTAWANPLFDQDREKARRDAQRSGEYERSSSIPMLPPPSETA